MKQKTIVLTFSPAQVCTIGDCTELSGIGQLSDYVLMAACPKHGLAWECSEHEQFTSVARFVHHLFDGEGSARVLSTAPLEMIPGYAPLEDARSVDRAWLVEWTCQDRLKRLYVVWIVDLLEFEVYQ